MHGDLKPENLLLTEKGHLKLIDFGSAFDFSTASDGHRQKEDTLQGTADYTAPEVIFKTPYICCETLTDSNRATHEAKNDRIQGLCSLTEGNADPCSAQQDQIRHAGRIALIVS